MDKLFSILNSNPLATLLVAGVLILVFMVLFRKIIERYLVKKYNLFTEQEVKTFAKTMINGKQYSKKQIDTAIETRFKKYMKARAVLLMMLISLIGFTGFAHHSDLRQNSDVGDVICVNTDTITTSGMAKADFNLQKTTFSFADSVARYGMNCKASFIEFNQRFSLGYLVKDVGTTLYYKPITTTYQMNYSFKPISDLKLLNLYHLKSVTNYNNTLRLNSWVVNPFYKARDSLRM